LPLTVRADDPNGRRIVPTRSTYARLLPAAFADLPIAQSTQSGRRPVARGPFPALP